MPGGCAIGGWMPGLLPAPPQNRWENAWQEGSTAYMLFDISCVQRLARYVLQSEKLNASGLLQSTVPLGCSAELSGGSIGIGWSFLSSFFIMAAASIPPARAPINIGPSAPMP